MAEVKKSVADGKNLLGSVIGGNQNSSFQELTNNAQALLNSKLQFKTGTYTCPEDKILTDGVIEYVIEEDIGFIPKYIFAYLHQMVRYTTSTEGPINATNLQYSRFGPYATNNSFTDKHYLSSLIVNISNHGFSVRVTTGLSRIGYVTGDKVTYYAFG